MKKTINLKFTITILTIFIAIIALLFSSIAFAEQNQDSQLPNKTVTIGIDQAQQAQQPISCENGLFTYANGTMKIDVVGATFSGEAKSVSVESPASVTVTLTPNEGCVVSDLMDAGQTVGPLSGDFEKTYQNSNVVKDCAFEPFFIQDQPGPEPEPVPKIDKGHIKLSPKTLGKGTAYYKIGDAPNFSTLTADLDIAPETMAGNDKVYLKLVPSDNNAINKEGTKVSDGTKYLEMTDTDFNGLINGSYCINYNSETTYGQYAHLEILETRSINITLTEASKQMLTNQLTLIAGHGDRNDVKVTSPKTSNTLYVDKGTEETLILSFAIKNKTYFIPSITVNNQVYSTVDTGIKDEEGNIIICSTLKDSAASASSFKVDLSIFAEVITDNKSDTIQELNASYEVMKEGALINVGEYGLTANDTAKDPMVNDALVTFDLGLTKDNVEAHEVTDGMEVHLGLDVATFADGNYMVVRNHDGQVEALDTTCELIRDRETGEVKGIDVGFNSDKFSEYSIVPANWQPVAPEESTTAQTGDATPIIPFVIAALFALGLVAISSKKNALSNK